ncbi:hypothetical protein WICPIJ_007364 [Wickerhamomyces pijperi]|uniref:Glycosyltransferase family 8 protein n=1 Tax=Wickerhamomyces pijperi TaxID=599730 RepID=A0A9P8TK06_WICPI|nr:hypothetical protein WICPIJ_007364 [Wickerhamomyces pijperi]
MSMHSSFDRITTSEGVLKRLLSQIATKRGITVLCLSVLAFFLIASNYHHSNTLDFSIPGSSTTASLEYSPLVYDGTNEMPFEEQQQDSTASKVRKPTKPQSELDMQEPYKYFQSQDLLSENVMKFSNPQDEENPLIDFDRGSAKYIQPEVIDYLYKNVDPSKVNWSKYAYVLYATSGAHLCNSFMVFSELRKYGSKADMVLIVNEDFLNKPDDYPQEYKELTEMKDKLQLKYSPVKPITIDSNEAMKIWVSSYTKLLVFGETSYDRIIYMDADSVLLQQKHLDELFFLPPCQVATPAAYWLIDEKFGKMGSEAMMKKYPPEKYGFKPTTVKERLEKIGKYIQSYIAPFMTMKLNTLNHIDNEKFDSLSTDDKITYKSFQNSVYNNLPSYPYLEDYKLTNIIMVIQPSEELFNRIKWGIETKSQDGRDEYDMDIIERLFDLKVSQSMSLSEKTKTLNDRLHEIPEYLILPPKRYAALTLQFNLWTDHETFALDSFEQAWSHVRSPDNKDGSDSEPYYYEIRKLAAKDKNQGDYLRPDVKYLHFSDAPIPKPWWYRDPTRDYMSARTRCPEFEEFHRDDLPEGWVLPGSENTNDCSAAKVWEWSVKHFEEVRKEVCGLDLAKTEQNTYFDIIN